MATKLYKMSVGGTKREGNNARVGVKIESFIGRFKQFVSRLFLGNTETNYVMLSLNL